MRLALIGHRGVGKSACLERVTAYFASVGKKVECLDLDREIETRARRPIAEIFRAEGEAAFRRIEREVFAAIDAKTLAATHDVFVALGAGFSPDAIPEAWRTLWIRRPSDASGRIFVDRPRLNAEVPPLDEYLERHRARNEAFAARADDVLWIDEGLEDEDSAERDFFLGRLRDLGGAISLRPEHFRSPQALEAYLGSRVRAGVRWFELRDDLLSPEEMDQAVRLLPDDRILIAFRSRERQEASAHLLARGGLAFDWPVERGPCPETLGEPRVLSLHERGVTEPLASALGKFPKVVSSDTTLKAAMPVRSWTELKEAHEWRRALPEARVFLPMSDDGRWSWYRLFESLAPGAARDINFIREGEGTSADQPTLLQWARARGLKPGSDLRFAAVLGDPVKLSRTPMEQREFFSSVASPVFAIRVTPEEWRQERALDTLKSLGLRWAAVTSPLKELAREACEHVERKSEGLRAVNTLQWSDERRWSGANTDVDGFAAAVAAARLITGTVAVWGGGGTLSAIAAALPTARFFSARTHEDRAGGAPAGNFHPDTVIWAVGGSRNLEAPPWHPRLVLDLNYTEDSPGRAFALERGARYISGLAFFKAQAEKQRAFWELS